MTIVITIILLTAFINLLLGIISYNKNPRSATHRFLTVLTFIFACWTIANYFSVSTSNPKIILFWIRLVMFITAPMGPILYLFVRVFPNNELKINKYSLTFLIVITIVVELMTFTPLIFSSVSITDQVRPIAGPGIPLFALIFIGGPILSMIEIFRKYKKAQGIEKLQLRYLTFGITGTFLLLMITNFISVVIFQFTSLVIFGPIFTLIFVASVFYAIVKHRLLAIRLVVARSVTFSLVILILATIYTFGIFSITRYILVVHNVLPQRIDSILIAIFLVLTFEPIKNLVERATNRVFFRGKYNTDELIFELTTLTASTFKLNTLSQMTLQKLISSLHIENGAFVIYKQKQHHSIICEGYDKNPQFNKQMLDTLYELKRMVLLDEEPDQTIQQIMIHLDIAVALPLTEHDLNEGLLLLGNKKSGQIYTPQDITVLEIFGPMVSIAIQNAKSYDEIKSFNKTLKQEVVIATKELQKSHKKLQELDKQKDRFLGMASHELKTPVTSIKAFTQLLQKRVKQKNHIEYASLLENINTQTDKITKLINDLLNVSNIEAGKFNLKRQNFDLNKLLTKTISNIQYTADKHVIIQKGSVHREVYGDTDSIEQVLSNLLINAMKYSPKADKIVVTVEEDNRYATISVSDFGPGIEKKDQAKIFERFYRTKEYEEKNIAGFGLGLYIASEIIKRHEGKIWVTSEKGEGATFSFTIPLKK